MKGGVFSRGRVGTCMQVSLGTMFGVGVWGLLQGLIR